jgi:ABC-type Fe3+ transport system permease subunit
VHGIPLRLYLLRVVIPAVRPTLFISFLLVGLLAAADVCSTLLLQPPGETTFGGRIFAVMDNASVRLVACLCLVYLFGGFLAVAACFGLGALRNRVSEFPAL